MQCKGLYNHGNFGYNSVHSDTDSHLDFNALRKGMDGYEKCSLVALFIAYIVIILLITIYEVTECQMSRIKQILNVGNRFIH